MYTVASFIYRNAKKIYSKNNNKQNYFVDRFLVMFYFIFVIKSFKLCRLVRALLKTERSVLFINQLRHYRNEEGKNWRETISLVDVLFIA